MIPCDSVLAFAGDNDRAVRGVDWTMDLDLYLCGVRPAGQVW